MVRITSFIAAVGTAAALLGATASSVQAQSPQYRAVPVAAVEKTASVVVGEVLWRCAPGGCTTTAATARPAIVCAQAAKKVGKLESFTAGSEAFDADALAKCNAKAKGGDTALARAN